MCKHIATTICQDWLEDGQPTVIHQCDMCGMLLPRMEIELIEDIVAEDLPPVDEVAFERRFILIGREILTKPQKAHH